MKTLKAIENSPTATGTSGKVSCPSTTTDALGRTVDQIDAGQLSAGAQTIRWERKGQSAGVYFFRLSFDGQPAGTRRGVLSE